MPELTDDQWAKLEAHYALLRKWNAHAGLVSPHTLDRAWPVHYCDSICMARFVSRFVRGENLRDIGSGGGFPGIVYAVLYPQHRIRLYERNKKKRSFLLLSAGELQLSNCEVMEEDAGPSTELLLSRATFGAEKFFASVRSLLLDGGMTVLSWGGGEKKFTDDPAFKTIASAQYVLPDDAGSRNIQILQYQPV